MCPNFCKPSSRPVTRRGPGARLLLGMGGMTLCVIMAAGLFGVPFRGSFWVLGLTSGLFLLGKSLAPLLVGIVERTVIVATAVFWFGVPLLGSLLLLYVGMILFLLAVIGIGLVISSLVRTQQQASLGASLFLVPPVTLSGFATPIANMSKPVQLITFVDPMGQVLVIVRGIFLQNMLAELVVRPLWPLSLIALASLSLSRQLFRNRLH